MSKYVWTIALIQGTIILYITSNHNTHGNILYTNECSIAERLLWNNNRPACVHIHAIYKLTREIRLLTLCDGASATPESQMKLKINKVSVWIEKTLSSFWSYCISTNSKTQRSIFYKIKCCIPMEDLRA